MKKKKERNPPLSNVKVCEGSEKEKGNKKESIMLGVLRASGNHERKHNVTPKTCVLPIRLPDLSEKAKAANLSLGRLYVLLHQIYVVWIFNESNDDIRKKKFHQQGWVNLSTIRLRVICSDKKLREYEQFLVDQHIIEIKRAPSGSKSYSADLGLSTPYRIMPNLLTAVNGRRFKHVKINEYKVLVSIKNDRKKYESGKYGKFENKGLPLFPIHIEMQKMLPKFYFDTDGLHEFLNKLRAGTIQSDRKTLKGLYDAEMTATLYNEGNIRTPSTCFFGERVYTNFSSTPREYRQFIRIKGVDEPLCNIDFKNSLPFLCALLIENPDVFRQVLPDFTPVLEKLKSVQKITGALFVEQCKSGTIYEKWQDLRKLETRDEAKDEFIQRILFDKLTYKQKPYKYLKDKFKAIYPDVWEAIRILKTMTEKELPIIQNIFVDDYGRFEGEKAYHKTISCILMRLESRLVRTIAQLMINQGVEVFLTVHDSFMVPSSQESQVKSIIQDFFIRRLGVDAPKLKTTTYGPVAT